jgi:hypothetical protein
MKQKFAHLGRRVCAGLRKLNESTTNHIPGQKDEASSKTSGYDNELPDQAYSMSLSRG